MVAHLIFLLLLAPALAFSGEFTSSVTSNQIHLGDNLTLSLALKDASTKTSPTLDMLNEAFQIHSQQQSHNTMMRNGHVSSSIIWKVILIPKREGSITIPSISVNTAEGVLSTQPITINVLQANPNDPNISALKGITTSIEFSKRNPYKNEPFFLSAQAISKHRLTNVQIEKLNVEDAIVEANGEPQIHQRIVDGVKVDVIEMNYMITPLKPGPLKIPSVMIQGGIPMKSKRSQSNFDNFFDSVFIGFDQLQPFSVATEETVIDVQAPIPSVQPWLPAKAFTIEEIWDEAQSLQVGEPFTRNLKIVATGIASNHLPSLNVQQSVGDNFKVYADKPEMAQEVKGSEIYSFRKEQYTLIPQQAGERALPAIAIDWYDVNTNEKKTASIPSRTLQIMAAVNNVENPLAFNDEDRLNSQGYTQQSSQSEPLLYAIIGGLLVAFLAVLAWALSLQQKMKRLTGTSPIRMPMKSSVSQQDKKEVGVKSKKEKLPDLNPT